MRIRRSSSSALLRLLFFVSICTIIALVCRIITQYFYFITFFSGITNLALASGSMGFMITEAWTTKIFMPKMTAWTMKKLVFLQVAVHIITATPIYFKGFLFTQNSDPIFFAKWFKYTSGVWWGWCIFMDTILNIWLAREIVALSARMIVIKTQSGRSQTSKSAASNGSVISNGGSTDASSSNTPQLLKTEQKLGTRKSVAPVKTYAENIVRRFQLQFRKTIVWMVIFSIIDVTSVVTYFIYVLNYTQPGSVKNRHASAFSQIATSSVGLHLLAVSLLIRNLTRLVRIPNDKI
ncbi:hypothetical protein RTP6_003415 [Batrachochytrium dendrobatidis]